MTAEVPVDLDLAVRAAADVLRGARTVVVVGHIDPDGDALGSLLATSAALDAIGIDVHPSWGGRDAATPPAPLDPALSFLPLRGRVRAPEDLPPQVDVLVCCDTAAAGRLGTLQPLVDAAGTVVVIDHHAVGDGFGDIRIVDDTASCTGVLVLRLIDALGVELTPAMADALYLALLTDTGRFSFASTGPADHRVAARLLEAGADHVGVTRAVYESASAGYLGLVARTTGRATVSPELVWSWTTREDLVDSGAEPHETDGLIELLRRVDTVDVALLMRETDGGRWRSSLRSRGGTDVAAVAQRLGGGGHHLAAGFTADGDPADIADRVRAELRTHAGAGSR